MGRKVKIIQIMYKSEQFNYAERHKLFPNTAIISYPFAWGGQLADRSMWMMEVNGEVDDYQAKETLKKQATEMGLPWVVLCCHKNGLVSVKEDSE
jgi:hypothetical protein